MLLSDHDAADDDIQDFKKIHLNMSSAKFRPFCSDLDVLRCTFDHPKSDGYKLVDYIEEILTIHNTVTS